MTLPSSTRWKARPVLATALRIGMFAVPFLMSSAAIAGVGRLLGRQDARSWWGLVLLFSVGVLMALAVERGTRRLLPVALLLRLSMVFPDRAPSRLALARAVVARQPRTPSEGASSSTDLVLHLVRTLSAHDRRTRGHSERVRVLTDMLAREVGLDAGARDRLRWAALLHDIGKVEVPTVILNKPGRLDAAEFDTVRRHPQAGADLALPLLGWLGAEGAGILEHHEKFDGSGYPAGKARGEISAAGRLIGLVDAFETMTATRPYKKAMATRAAREELARCAGTHFDPTYVRAFLAISLPRVLWAMGPLSFFAQLPYLRSLAQAGSRGTSLAPQAIGSLANGAAGAAGAAVLVTGGLVGGAVVASAGGPPVPLTQTAVEVMASASPDADALTAGRPAVAVVAAQPTPALAPTPPATAEESPAELPVLSPAPEPTGLPDLPAPPPLLPRPEPGPLPEPLPSPRPFPSPEPSPTPSPEPPTSPAPTSEPTPAPSGRPTPTSTPAPTPLPTSLPTPLPTPLPVLPTAAPSPTSSPAAPTGEPSPAPTTSPSPSTPTGPPTADPVPAPTPSEQAARPAAGHTVFRDGPDERTTLRDATFTLVDQSEYECQLRGNGDGGTSAWRPCAGTVSLRGLRLGDHQLRVRDRETNVVLDAWNWTIEESPSD